MPRAGLDIATLLPVPVDEPGNGRIRSGNGYGISSGCGLPKERSSDHGPLVTIFTISTQGRNMFLKRFFKFIPKNDYSRGLDLFNEGHYKKALKIFEDLLARHGGEEDLDTTTCNDTPCRVNLQHLNF